MLDNQTRRELLSKARQSGFPGSILDVFAAYEQGRDLVAEFQQQQEQQQTQQMSEQAAQQSGMQMPQQMQQEQPQQGPPQPQGPPQGLPQGSRIPQPPSPNTGLVNSNESQATGLASNASGKFGGQEILAMGGFRKDEYNKFSTHFPFSKEQRGTIAHNATVEHPDLTMVQGKKYVFGGLKYGEGGMQKDPPDMPFGLPLKEQNIYTLPEYNQPKNPKTGEILPDPQRPNLGMGTGANEYKMTYGVDGGDVDVPSIVAGQYIGDQAYDRYNLTGERFKTMTDPGSYSKFYEQIGRLGLMQEKRQGGFKYEDDMAKKLQKNTAISRATSLKANVTRKFEVGGTGDPIKPRPAEVQPFPDFYTDNKKEFDAADAAGRQRLTNWFDQRAAATGVYPEHTKSATVLSDYLKNSGQSVYVPEPKVKKGEDAGEAFKNMFTGIEMADSQAFANEADYTQRPASDQTAADRALNADKYSFPDDPKAKINATGTPLVYNTAYYRGMHGAKPSTHLEEQLHLASGFAQEMEPEHLKSFKDKEVQAAINPENMKAMGYFNKQTDKAGNVIGTTPLDEESINYFTGVEKGKQTDEFYPRLMTGRSTLGLQGGEKYDATQMGNFLQQGYDNLKAGKYTEPGLQEHLIEFYRSIGYPLPSSEFTKGATPEQIEQQKAKAAEAFRIANDKYAMQKKGDATSVEYSPLVSRYGGYRTRR